MIFFNKEMNQKTSFTDVQELLLYARRQEIRGISLNPSDTVDRMTPITGLQNAIGIDYHFEKQWIYWTDVTKDSISRIHLNGSSRQDIIPSGRLDYSSILFALDVSIECTFIRTLINDHCCKSKLHYPTVIPLDICNDFRSRLQACHR